jgi:hypothetical protein
MGGGRLVFMIFEGVWEVGLREWHTVFKMVGQVTTITMDYSKNSKTMIVEIAKTPTNRKLY